MTNKIGKDIKKIYFMCSIGIGTTFKNLLSTVSVTIKCNSKVAPIPT